MTFKEIFSKILFQFQYGAIERNYLWEDTDLTGSFQFQYGAIESYSKK